MRAKIVLENIINTMKRIYYKRFGIRCECGSKLLGFKHCLSFNHDENVMWLRRDNKLNKILKNK